MELTKDIIKSYYPTLWDDKKVANAVEKGKITNEDFEEITGKSIYDVGDLDAAKDRKQSHNKKALAQFLSDSTITWTDSCKYGVTEEDQNELSLNLNQYQLQIAAGIENPILEWHPKKSVCRPFTVEEFTGLVLAIKNFVYPYVSKCQDIKTQIYNATTLDELKAVEIIYEETVE